MNEPPTKARDYSETLFLPKTDFPMRAGLPQREPEILARWKSLDLYGRLRAAAKGRPRFILHDGPPYANGNIHIGHALNKILKDVVTKSQQMLGFDSNYVPGWDCHGLPIEWKIEEENYRAKGAAEAGFVEPGGAGGVPPGVPGFRRALDQRAAPGVRAPRRHRRLGASLHHDGFLRRGADRARTDEVRRQRHALSRLKAGDVVGGGKDRARRGGGRVRGLCLGSGVGEVSSDFRQKEKGASHHTNCTMPLLSSGRQRLGRSPETAPSAIRQKSNTGFIEVTDAPDGNWAKKGDRLILSKKLAIEVMRQARVLAYREIKLPVAPEICFPTFCAHPLHSFNPGYEFAVPLLPGDHVTDDTGTGFVHTAPGHGREDFDVWTANARELAARGHQHDDPLHRRCRRPLHRAGARLHRQARTHRKRREGRRQRGGDQGLDRCRHADRARALEAPVSAFVALEEAGDLPQHAAMVHRHGHTYRVEAEARAHTASACQRGD